MSSGDLMIVVKGMIVDHDRLRVIRQQRKRRSRQQRNTVTLSSDVLCGNSPMFQIREPDYVPRCRQDVLSLDEHLSWEMTSDCERSVNSGCVVVVSRETQSRCRVMCCVGTRQCSKYGNQTMFPDVVRRSYDRSEGYDCRSRSTPSD